MALDAYDRSLLNERVHLETEEPAPVFTPDNEPYLGRHPLFVLDKLIPSALTVHNRIAAATHEGGLNPLQLAACQIIPQGVSLALTIREMVRQGYLFGAAVLVRPLIERAAIISYLIDHPESLNEWEAGWRHRTRPSLREMLQSLRPGEQHDVVKEIIDQLDHLIHGDPMGAEGNLVETGGGGLGYSVGRILDEPRFADWLCDQTISWLIVLTGRAASLFPHVRSVEK
jgi:hypothetical protein